MNNICSERDKHNIMTVPSSIGKLRPLSNCTVLLFRLGIPNGLSQHLVDYTVDRTGMINAYMGLLFDIIFEDHLPWQEHVLKPGRAARFLPVLYANTDDDAPIQTRVVQVKRHRIGRDG